MSRSENALPITEGALFGQILRFSLPLALSGMLQLLFNAADVIVVGKFAGSDSLAAVGVPGSLINLLVALFVGISVGVNIVVARYLGSQDDDGLRRAIPTSVILSVLMGLFIMVIGFFFSRPLLAMIQTPEELMEKSALYTKIYFLGIPGSLVYNFGAAILRAWGDTKRPLYYLTAAGIINVILNLILVIVFHLDVAGVAIATCVSQYVSMALVLRSLMKAEGACRLDLRHPSFHFKEALRIIQIGVPAGLQSVILNISNVMIQSSVNSFGTAVIAANTAAGNLDGFLYMAGNSVFHASITFASQNLAAGKPERVRRTFWDCMLAVIVICVIPGILMYLFGPKLLNIYVNQDDAMYDAIIAAGMIKLLYVSVPRFTCSTMEVACGMVRGLGKTWLPMIITIFGACVLRIVWIYTFFVWDHTLANLYLSYPVSWIATTCLHAACFFVFFRRISGSRKEPVSDNG